MIRSETAFRQFLRDVDSDSYTPAEHDSAWVWVYKTEPCESCGATCRAPNALQVRPPMRARERLETMLKLRKHLPPEQYYDEQHDGCVCEYCSTST